MFYTNTIEGFWAGLKRGVLGIYHSWSKKYLQDYVDEFVFRYNTRDYSDSERFNLLISNACVRTKYRELILWLLIHYMTYILNWKGPSLVELIVS